MGNKLNPLRSRVRITSLPHQAIGRRTHRINKVLKQWEEIFGQLYNFLKQKNSGKFLCLICPKNNRRNEIEGLQRENPSTRSIKGLHRQAAFAKVPGPGDPSGSPRASLKGLGENPTPSPGEDAGGPPGPFHPGIRSLPAFSTGTCHKRRGRSGRGR